MQRPASTVPDPAGGPVTPGPASAFDPEDIPYFFDNWCSLSWTPWVPFNADKHTFGVIPHEPGLYRIRPAGRDFLMYIGGTGRTLHLRLNALRQSLRRADLMPWSDPLPEAPALWAWWSDWLSNQEEEKKLQVSSTVEWLSEYREPSDLGHEKNSSEFIDREKDNPTGDEALAGETEKSRQCPPDTPGLPEPAVMLECSAAPLDASAAGRKGMEAFLLYRYRQERGESPLCNFGRFHPRYRKSTTRREGLRGGRLAEKHKDNPAGWPGIGPLEATGKPGDRDWMGLDWSAWEPLEEETIAAVPAGAGLYLLADAGSLEIVYIGQGPEIAGRLRDHGLKSRDGRPLAFSYQVIGQAVLPHHLRELETDLVGNFFETGQVVGSVEDDPAGSFTICRQAPAFQYRQAGSQKDPL